MPALGSRGAYTCARCEVRQLLLRRNGSTPTSFLAAVQQRRHESTDDSPFTSHEGDRTSYEQHRPVKQHYAYKSFKPDGTVSRRGKRRTERSEHLKIKSLDKDSEIIILRELPEYMARQTPTRKQDDTRDETEAESTGPTTQDIQKLFSEDLPATEEIIASIEQHKPSETVLSQAEYKKTKSILSDSFVSEQLLLYLHKKLPVDPMAIAKSNPKSKKRAHHPATNRPGTVELSSAAVTRLAISPWGPSTSKSAGTSKPKPMRPMTRRNLAKSSKTAMLDGIMRQVWGVQTEEENESRGKVEITLSPQQWGLLNTREDKDLFAALRARKFFQRTTFNRDPKKGALIIRGPRSEADLVSKLIEKAFAGASSTEINLKGLEAALYKGRAHDFEVRFSQSKLRDLMYMTRTFIHFDKDRLILEVAGFHKEHVEDATRLLVMMLDMQKLQTNRNIILPQSELLVREPIHVAGALPSWARPNQYTRLRLRYLRSKSSLLEKAHRDWSKAHSGIDVLDQIDKHIGTIAEKEIHSAKHATYWKGFMSTTPPVASYGFILKPELGSTIPEPAGIPAQEETVASDVSESAPAMEDHQAPDARLMFVKNVPALPTVMSGFERLTLTELGTRSSVEPRVIAKLIPSPLTENGAEQMQYPTISFAFALSPRTPDSFSSLQQQTAERSESQANQLLSHRVLTESDLDHLVEGHEKQQASQTSGNANVPNGSDEQGSTDPGIILPYSCDIDDKSKMVLKSIRATIREKKINVPLPDRAVDVQFTTKRIVKGKVKPLLELEEIKAFVDQIMTSMREGTDLRAPATVNIPLVRSMLNTKSQRKGTVTVPYFFAGFEHREIRRLRAAEDHKPHVPRVVQEMKGGWAITDVEGGVSGGRYIELSARQSPEMSKSAFIESALGMADFIHRVHTGSWRPKMRQLTEEYEKSMPAQTVTMPVIGGEGTLSDGTREIDPYEQDVVPFVDHDPSAQTKDPLAEAVDADEIPVINQDGALINEDDLSVNEDKGSVIEDEVFISDGVSVDEAETEAQGMEAEALRRKAMALDD
ncbi:hypothetical protein K461DRAFT_313778 [Myriangium duriaei CBS 260.36]|uniref:Uncharacterized protein n=1 Tax=Myriangium duriaei CBS 260.36 TaxID=1168546 RepID=A0A9P4IY42_9PEZI|nr:hypothetical protein K461DRAFT_313778 [Myriangium duriaei CBS 260.36]